MDAHDMALLSLFSGLRAGECADLTWADISFDEGLIFVKDIKKSHNRHAYITAEIRQMLKRRLKGRQDAELVFPGPRGGLRSCASRRPFKQTVKLLKLNDGTEDPRQKVVFHTMRHTFASWLAQTGTPLYTVSKLMGHSDIKMTIY